MSRHSCSPVASAAPGLYICLTCKATYRKVWYGEDHREGWEALPVRERRQALPLPRSIPAGPAGSYTKDKDRAIASRQVRDYWK